MVFGEYCEGDENRKGYLVLGLLQNFRYSVVRANNVEFEFSVADFSLMNLNDLISITNILINLDVSKIPETNRNDFILGFGHIKAFLDSYYEYLAITDNDLVIAIKKTVKVPQTLAKAKLNINEFEDGEIIHHPYGVVFGGKK